MVTVRRNKMCVRLSLLGRDKEIDPGVDRDEGKGEDVMGEE